MALEPCIELKINLKKIFALNVTPEYQENQVHQKTDQKDALLTARCISVRHVDYVVDRDEAAGQSLASP